MVSRRAAIKTMLLTGITALIPTKVIRACETTPDIEGPFYIPGSPYTTSLAPSGAAGTKMFITGTVYARDCQTPIADAVVDVWHANDAGEYENTNYRAKVKTDSNGSYSYETIVPGKYLNGAQYRPRHLHYKVNAPGESVLTTQIYFKGDTSIPSDPWASDPDANDRIIELTTDTNGYMHGVADVYLDVDAVGIEHGSKSMLNGITSVYPNPIVDQGEVSFSLTEPGSVEIKLYDLQGKSIKSLVTGKYAKGQHKIVIDRLGGYGFNLPSGIYVIKQYVNERPVSAKRVYFQ